MQIFDAAGRLIREWSYELSGGRTVQQSWRGVDLSERPVGSGIYFVRLVGPDVLDTQRITLLK